MYSDSFPYGTLDEVTALVIYVLVFPLFLCNGELFQDPGVKVLELLKTRLLMVKKMTAG